MRLPSYLSTALVLLAGATTSFAGPVAHAALSADHLVKTPLGRVQGSVAGTGGASRHSVRYGVVDKRWTDSRVVKRWHDTLDGTALPPSCPQAAGYSAGSAQSEDCLYSVVYTPKGAKNLPVMVWIHGGSFVAGSASAPGLDGAAFAEANQVIVVVIQYRLGVLGLLPPSHLHNGTPNHAVQDVINSLDFLQQTLASFGGNANKVTLAGQSSGGQMVRALLSSPKSKHLFRAAILQSDPMNYGMASPSTTSLLTSSFYGYLAPQASDLGSLRTLDLDALLTAQTTFLAGAFTLDPSIPLASPLRPTSGDHYVPSDLAQALTKNTLGRASNALGKSVLFTTTKDELGTTVGGLTDGPISEDEYEYFISLFAPDEQQAKAILDSENYRIGSGEDAARETLLKVGTEFVWTCAVRAVADLWRSRGGRVWVGEFEKGDPYADNVNIPFCAGKVCHEDDIFATLGTGQQTGLSKEVLARWGNFVKRLDPNAPGLKTWTQYSGEDSILALGDRSDGAKASGTCPAGFWGTTPTLFDWQAFSE